MRLATKQDVEAPIGEVFAELTDFAQFERMAVRRGADIERIADVSAGAAWRVAFPYRGKLRNLVIRSTEITPNQVVAFDVASPSVNGVLRLELLSLAARRTRISLVSEIQPRSLSARLLVQSLRLAKGRVQRRLDESLRELTKHLVRRSRGSGGR